LESATSELIQFFEFVDGSLHGNGIGTALLGECLRYQSVEKVSSKAQQ
jgi:hypothetical protein